MVVNCGGDVEFDGGENVALYDSSEWAERGFCRNCGSHLFYRLKGQTEYQIPVGTFEDQGSYSFALQVFVDKKPEFYSFANKTKEMTENEVIAEFGPEQNT